MSAIVYPYLGTPGSMVQLPGPSGPIESSPTRGDVVHTDLAGGVGVTRRLKVKRTFVAPYTSRPGTGTDDTLLGFYQGLYGDGPFVLVDPSVTNVLPLDVSTCGLRSNASPGWIATSGTVAAAGGASSPVTRSGVLTWTTPASGASLHPGLVALTADINTAPAYLPGEAVTVSMYLKVSSGGTHTLVLNGYNSVGVSIATSTQSVALTTSYQRFSVSIAAGLGGFASCIYVLPRLLTTAGALTFSIAAVQLEYGTTASTWSPGFGAPRVLMTATPGRLMDRFDDYSTHTLTLGEVG